MPGRSRPPTPTNTPWSDPRLLPAACRVACRHRCSGLPADLPSSRSRAHRRCDMAKVSKETASEVMAVDGFEGRTQDLGGYTVAYETFTSDQDPAPLFVGLPDDHCQCPHWGYLISGKFRAVYKDHEETISAGDIYYLSPGH